MLTITKKRKKILLFSLFLAILSVPIITGIYYAVAGKNSKDEKIFFLESESNPMLTISSDKLPKIQKNIFENNNNFYYFENKLRIEYSALYGYVSSIIYSDKNFDFSKIKSFLVNIDILELNFFDLYYYLKLCEILKLENNKNAIYEILEKHWLQSKNLFFFQLSTDDFSTNLSITRLWASYLVEKNDQRYIPHIKKEFEKQMEIFFSDVTKDSEENKTNRNLLLNLGVNLKYKINRYSESIKFFYKSLKSDLISKNDKNLLKILNIVRLLKFSKFYFLTDDEEIKTFFLKTINTIGENYKEGTSIFPFDLLEISQYIDINKIDKIVLNKYLNLFSNSISTGEIFSTQANIKKTYYSLLFLKSINIDINKQKISNFLTNYNYQLQSDINREDSNRIIQNILYRQKIKELLDIKESKINKDSLFEQLKFFMKRDLDYQSVFNILQIMKIENIDNVSLEFVNLSKEIVNSFIAAPVIVNKEKIYLYINYIDKSFNFNLIDENDLVESLNSILKDEYLTMSGKEVIYDFLLSIQYIKSDIVKEKIKNLLIENKSKIFKNFNNNDYYIFINGLLDYEFKKIGG